MALVLQCVGAARHWGGQSYYRNSFRPRLRTLLFGSVQDKSRYPHLLFLSRYLHLLFSISLSKQWYFVLFSGKLTLKHRYVSFYLSSNNIFIYFINFSIPIILFNISLSKQWYYVVFSGKFTSAFIHPATIYFYIPFNYYLSWYLHLLFSISLSNQWYYVVFYGK